MSVVRSHPFDVLRMTLSLPKGQLLVVFVLSFLILTKFNIDPDFGWHMAYGETFLKTGEIIRGDPFSWTMPGYMWGNSYFLYQIFVAAIFNKFGYLVLGLVFGLIAAFAVLILSFKNLNFFKALFIILGAIVAGTNLGIRPHNISFFFFAMLLVFLEKDLFKKPKHILFWLLFFGLWSNIHRAAAFGLLVFCLFLILEFLQKRKKTGREKLIWMGCFLAGILGTVLTPNPLSLWHSGVIGDLTTYENLRYIAEWQPLALVPPASIFLAASGIVFILMLRKSHNKIGLTLSLIGAFLFSFAFVSATFTFFWAALFIFIVCRYLEVNFKIAEDFWSKLPISFSVTAAIGALFLNFVLQTLESYDFGARLARDKYPVGALEYLTKEGLGANLFNSYEWGGFVDWKYPGVRVFIDGRMAGWKKADGTSILGDYVAIGRGECNAADKYKIETVLVKRKFEAPCFSEWKIEYQDEVSKILRRPM